MNTPICDFVRTYAESNTMRLHMPGHKGVGPLGVERLDITEIDGADVLYQSHGIIRESEDNAAELFGTARTVYSTEGSSLSIRAMLYLAVLWARENGKRPHIFAGRSAHKVFMHTAALLDFDVTFVGDITADSIDSMLKAAPEPPTAIYVTSPNYIGETADIKRISEHCRKYGVLLLVDNAHGAYFKFIEESRHPIDLGADMCCDSAHKTLPVLTGGAYLHISKNAPPMFAEQCERAMELFASTSPSYLILQSLDAANRCIADGYPSKLRRFIREVILLKSQLIRRDFLVSGDPHRMTFHAKQYGYTGNEFAEILLRSGIVCEFADPDYLVLMLTPEVGTEALAQLEQVLTAIPKRRPLVAAPPTSSPMRAMSIREAMMSPSEEIAVANARGRVLASAGVSCPPAVPIVICGEIIGEREQRAFEYYGITKVRVVK